MPWWSKTKEVATDILTAVRKLLALSWMVAYLYRLFTIQDISIHVSIAMAVPMIVLYPESFTDVKGHLKALIKAYRGEDS